MPCYEMRAVQIDLARQIETVDTVKQFFDAAASAGMNTVVLYLEDRIKTATYPYSPDEESYSEAQVRELVAYATALGLDLIPVVSPVGHTERFMRHPEMKHIAELRGKIAGAYNEAGVERYLATCPKLPETLAFFDAYIAEVAALFPSKFFHIGFDEIWDMGYCELCKHDKIEDLYYNAIMHFHGLLKGLGKDMMIWDDMLEQFPWVMEKLPKDIVLCAWFYQYTEQYPVARFSTSRSYDVFHYFEKLGFRYLGCPWMRGSIDTLTAYAAKRKPFGMLLTNWEMSDQQIAHLYPTIEYAGSLWSGRELPGEAAVLKAAAKYTDNEESALAVATAMQAFEYYGVQAPSNTTSYRLPCEEAYVITRTIPLVEAGLAKAAGHADMLDSFRMKLRRLKISYRLWEVGYALHEYRAGEGTMPLEVIQEELKACRAEVEDFEAMAMGLWKRCRPGIAAPQMEKIIGGMKDGVNKMMALAEAATPEDIGRLVVRYDLGEFTSSCTTTVTLHYADGSTYEAAKGTFKAMNVRTQKYEYSYEIPAKPFEAVTFSVCGYGASGVRYVTANMGGKEYIPSGITKVSGQVEHPEFILSDDSRAAVFNEQEMLQFFVNDISRRKANSVTVSLKEW
ncbi:MAG: family 20 glycosylhydrolase [Clostridia bacterium]|nr:family 20 glycosylhydrolase [Clostridia bacterium]